MMSRPQTFAVCLSLLAVFSLFHPCVDAARGGGGRASSRPSSFAAPAASRPTSTFAAPATRSGFGGSTFGGYNYARSGFRSRPILIGLGAGALTAVALSSLNSNPRAYCNGRDIQCYKTPCQNALAQCEATSNRTLNLIPCPDSRFSECYQTDDTQFQCFGNRRPSFGDNDVQGFCHSQGGGMNSATGVNSHLVLLSALALVAVVLM
eukprot:GHUV01001299.1.p1 GENE.GHUV01001299.1~~GHUV01001299.1.p1  ORF type:complete len:207 (+),score=15.83 GHUV01001299.1:277-897(+)